MILLESNGMWIQPIRLILIVSDTGEEIDVPNLGSDDNDLGIYNIDNINQDVD